VVVAAVAVGVVVAVVIVLVVAVMRHVEGNCMYGVSCGEAICSSTWGGWWRGYDMVLSSALRINIGEAVITPRQEPGTRIT
jgi:hypothetical protein